MKALGVRGCLAANLSQGVEPIGGRRQGDVGIGVDVRVEGGARIDDRCATRGRRFFEFDGDPRTGEFDPFGDFLGQAHFGQRIGRLDLTFRVFETEVDRDPIARFIFGSQRHNRFEQQRFFVGGPADRPAFGCGDIAGANDRGVGGEELLDFKFVEDPRRGL